MPEADKPLGALVRKTDIPMSVGLPTPEENRKWLGQQVVYANHVGKHDELDQKIATFVTNHRQMFYSRMGPVMRRWQTIWDAANGNPTWGEYEDDIHVPETQKKLEAKVARIEEALFEFDPIFEADGVRGDLPPWKAQVITSYVYRMMELAGFKKYVQPCARDQEICNVSALKRQRYPATPAGPTHGTCRRSLFRWRGVCPSHSQNRSQKQNPHEPHRS